MIDGSPPGRDEALERLAALQQRQDLRRACTAGSSYSPGLDRLRSAEQPRLQPKAIGRCEHARFLQLGSGAGKAGSFGNDDGVGCAAGPLAVQLPRNQKAVPTMSSSAAAATAESGACGQIARITRLALVPPKPKLLLSTAFTRPLLGDVRHEVDAPAGVARIVEVEVGGTIPSRIASMQKIASTAPAPPSRWPIADLVELIDSVPTALPNSFFTAPELELVAHRRRGAVRVDIVDVADVEPERFIATCMARKPPAPSDAAR
jgi:hypothetical protein